ncbi:hypothetical protein R3W88_001099 [Solanum pinnatisectum]|uniref:Helitron helicase-like domain-containing protein n=1 Tax=Solanum pinnatisectum TaxID=50273 RepID=A0AAV9MJC1_9SOLN|nr:hypothetical protein R3W88_001099 [Solanum pinnatisectum]
MIILIPRVDQDVVDEYINKHIHILLKHYVHEIHECCRSINQTKGHNKELIMTITGPKCCLRDVTFSHSQLMIARFEVYLRETNGTMKLVEKVINSRKGIFILYGDLVQLVVIDTYPK